MRFRSKLSLGILVLFMILGSLVTSLVYRAQKEALVTRMEDETRYLASRVINHLDQLLYEGLADIRFLATDPVLRSPRAPAERLAARLRRFRQTHAQYASLSLFNLDRVRLADTADRAPGEPDDVTAFWPQVTARNSPVLSLSRSGKAQAPVLHFAALIRTSEGEPHGVVVAHLHFSRVMETISHSLKKGGSKPAVRANEKRHRLLAPLQDYRLDLVDRRGELIFSNHQPETRPDRKTPAWESIEQRLETGVHLATLRQLKSPNETSPEVLSFARSRGFGDYPGNGWTALVHIPAEAFLAPVADLRGRILLTFSGLAVLTLTAVFVYARRVGRPLAELTRVATQVRRGNLEVRCRVASRDEVGTLAEAFNAMVDELQRSREKLLSFNSELAARIAEGTSELRAAKEELERELKERRRTQQVLQESEERFRAVAQTAVEAIIITDSRATILFWNRAAEQIFGYGENEALGEPITLCIPEPLRPGHERGMTAVRERGAAGLSGTTREVTGRRKDGRIVPLEMSLTTWQTEDETYFSAIIRDITERTRLKETLEEMLVRDELTGVYNRRGFLTLAEQELKVADRKQRELTLTFIDLDDMKLINDRLGHQMGDKALEETARLLRETFRRSDIIARMGGDEFAVLAPETALAEAGRLEKRLEEGTEAFNRKSDSPFRLSLSLGTASYDPAARESLESLMNRADKRMYREKQRKKRGTG